MMMASKPTQPPVQSGMLGRDKPLTFSSKWEGLRLLGKAIGLFMLTDHFSVDPLVVEEVKAAPTHMEVAEILQRAMVSFRP